MSWFELSSSFRMEDGHVKSCNMRRTDHMRNRCWMVEHPFTLTNKIMKPSSATSYARFSGIELRAEDDADAG